MALLFKNLISANGDAVSMEKHGKRPQVCNEHKERILKHKFSNLTKN
jgi:hypothetical protein